MLTWPKLLLLALLGLGAIALGAYAGATPNAPDSHARVPIQRVTVDPNGGTPGPP